MPAKRKTTTSRPKFHLTPQGIEVAPPEEKPQVQQVVEVVDDTPADTVPVDAPREEESLDPAGDPQSAPQEEIQSISQSAQGAEEQETRKELAEMFHGNSDSPIMPEISEHRARPHKMILLWATVVLGLCLFVGGAILVFTKGTTTLPKVSFSEPSPTLALESTASPSPVAPPDRERLTIEVQNGGGVPGAAGKMKTLLEKKGYTVSKTGNAGEYSYDTTEILVKPSFSQYLSLLEADLKDDYTIGTTAATLPEDDPADARVTVGKK